MKIFLRIFIPIFTIFSAVECCLVPLTNSQALTTGLQTTSVPSTPLDLAIIGSQKPQSLTTGSHNILLGYTQPTTFRSNAFSCKIHNGKLNHCKLKNGANLTKALQVLYDELPEKDTY